MKTRLNLKSIFLTIFFLGVLVSCGARKVKISTYNGAPFQFTTIRVAADQVPWIQSGLKVKEGDKILIIVSGQVKLCDDDNCKGLSADDLLYMKSGKHYPDALQFNKDYAFFNALYSGNLAFGIAEGDLATPAKYIFSGKKINSKPYRDNSGAFELDVYVIRDENKFELPGIIDDLTTKAVNPLEFAEKSENFIRFEGTALKEQKKQANLWNEFLQKTNSSSLEQYQFARQNLKHPKYWDMLDAVENTLLLEFKDLFWEIDPELIPTMKQERSDWINQAIILYQNGFTPCANLLAEYFYIGYDRIDIDKALQFAEKAASEDHNFSKFLIAKSYLRLKKSPENQEKGIALIHEILPDLKAHEQSMPMIAHKMTEDWQIMWQYYALGWLYSNGIEVPRNKLKAAQFYQKADDFGYPIARYNLSLSILRNLKVNNTIKGISLSQIQAFADAGFPRAQANLAFLYLQGIATKKNKKLAKEYYQKSTAGGYHPGTYFKKMMESF